MGQWSYRLDPGTIVREHADLGSMVSLLCPGSDKYPRYCKGYLLGCVYMHVDPSCFGTSREVDVRV
jgi:hypothetical protein